MAREGKSLYAPHENTDPRDSDLPSDKEGSGPELIQEISWAGSGEGLLSACELPRDLREGRHLGGHGRPPEGAELAYFREKRSSPESLFGLDVHTVEVLRDGV